MEIRRTISEVHEQPVLCVAYNPAQRHIFTGSQDSTIKCWHSENGEHVRTLKQHAGWVTGLVYATEIRVLFSCSIDGFIMSWSAKGELLDKERAGGKDAGQAEAGRTQSGPMYCIAWDARRSAIIVGANALVVVFAVSCGDNVDLHGGKKIFRLLGTLKDDKGRPPHAMRGTDDPVTHMQFIVIEKPICARLPLVPPDSVAN